VNESSGTDTKGLGRRLAFAGAVAVGAALSIGELIAGIIPGVPSPLLAVARFIVDIQPPGAKELVVALFGDSDKVAFQVFIVLVALGVGAALGRITRKHPDLGAAVLVVFTAAGFLASLRDPAVVATLSVAAAAVEALAGVFLLHRLVALAGPVAQATRGGGARVRAGKEAMPDWSRRSLLQVGGALAVGSVAAGYLGRVLLERQTSRACPRSSCRTTASTASIPRSFPRRSSATRGA